MRAVDGNGEARSALEGARGEGRSARRWEVEAVLR